MTSGVPTFPVEGTSWADYRDDPGLRGADRGEPGRGGWHYRRSAVHLHRGIDLKAATGTPVLAVEPGRVRFMAAESAHSAAGHRIWLFGDSGAVYYYLHLGTDASDPFDAFPAALIGRPAMFEVSAGTVIGYIGHTGGSKAQGTAIPANAAHLHFEYLPHGAGGPDANPASLFDRIR